MSQPEKCSTILAHYLHQVAPTDMLSREDLQPILLGMFGEVGSVMTTAKKYHREGDAYVGYRHAVEEELGDVLWYFAALCRRLNIPAEEIFAAADPWNSCGMLDETGDPDRPVSDIATPLMVPELDPALLHLGESAAMLFRSRTSENEVRAHLSEFAKTYMHVLRATRVAFADVVRTNIAKTRGRFVAPDYKELPTFDDAFPESERLPKHFEITIDERNSRSYLRWNGVFIGDALTDSIADRDGYRFHDVFHFAHAAILNWSPTFRALIKQKRKSDSKADEGQDGGRAIVVEEGLTAWIFSRAKALNLFEGQKNLSFDLLKTVQQFVSGYEVEACPLSLWEIAILRGYDVFRQVRTHRGGIIVCDRNERTIEYAPLKGK
jgi:NTP pyrophosphatase (non-canonical NTP hydrolase)